jgi:hypothetical protein
VWSATLVFALGCFERTASGDRRSPPGEQSLSLLARA